MDFLQICDPIYPTDAPAPQFCPSFYSLHYLDLSMSVISTQGKMQQQEQSSIWLIIIIIMFK